MTNKPIDDETMAGLEKSAGVIRGTLKAIEKHCEAKGDKRAIALMRAHHRALSDALETHGPALGVDVVAFSGGGPK